MGKNDELVEAVTNLRKAERDVIEWRIKVANLLKQAVDGQQSITSLHRQTDIGRTTIYWLINTWSTNSDNRN